MEDPSKLNTGDDDESRFESIRSRPVTPSLVMKVNANVVAAAGARGHSEEDNHLHKHRVSARQPTPTESFEISMLQNLEKGGQEEHYGLKILGCKEPRVYERAASALSHLKTIEEETPSQVQTTTDEHGDVIEVSESFQKLKITRNQPGQPHGGAGDGPEMPYHQEDCMNPLNNGITIKSLTSNTIYGVPETHRNTQVSKERASSGDEVRVHPNAAYLKSKISKTRRRKRIRFVAGQGPMGILGHFPSDGLSTDNQSLGGNEIEADSDVGGSDRDYSIPSTARSVIFDDFELMRPETASSEILADGTLAEEEGEKLKTLKKIFAIDDDDDWYATRTDSEEKAAGKSKIRQLAKLFYRRFQRDSEQGMIHTYKLMLAGLHNRLEDFVLLPVPPGFTVKMRITRVKKGVAGRLHPIYYLHLEREAPGDRKCLIMVAKKHTVFGGVGYILSTDASELNVHSEYCVGKISSNFIGTEFNLYSGRSLCAHIPVDRGALMSLPKTERFREELATTLYDPNVLGFKGPRKMTVIIPRMKNFLERETVCPRLAEESLLGQHQNPEHSRTWSLKNKDPVWNRESHAYILNFNGRVTKASVKNFQIVAENNEENVMLQFGRASENTFSLDFQYPFCPMQAFAIALTSFDSKLACE